MTPWFEAPTWRQSIGGPWKVMVPGAAGVIAYLGLLVWAMNHWRYTTWVVLLLFPTLAISGILILRWATARDDDPMMGVLGLALVVKLAAAWVRFYVSFELYGSGDSLQYHLDAVARADRFFAHHVSLIDLVTPRAGTASITDLTAMLYTVIGPARLGGFLVFSFIGFWGLFFFSRALRTGLPEADHVTYARLLFFLPSLVFWPSSIGKEAIMMFGIGLASLGAARITRRIPQGWLILVAGLAVGGLVRPHVSAVILVSVTIAVLFRRPMDERRGFGAAGRFGGVMILMVGLAFMFGQTAKYLVPGSTKNDVAVVGQVFDKATAGTAGGGSVIDRPLPNNPLQYPGAAFTVLFRPTILEARNPQNLAAAAETTVLLAILVARWRRLKQLPKLAMRRTYVLFATVYTGVFCFAWSAFANLGALARQRVQVWPLMLTLFCLPEVIDEVRARPSADRRRRPATPPTSAAATADVRDSVDPTGGRPTWSAPTRR